MTCSGYWNLHRPDAAKIHYYLTGNSIGFLPMRGKVIDYARVMNAVAVSDYILPMEPAKLASRLKVVMEYDENEARNVDDPHSCFEVKSGVLPPVFNFSSSRLDYWKGCAPLESAMAVREQIIKDSARESQLFPPLYILPKSLTNTWECHSQLRSVIAAHSLHQIFRQLEFIRTWCKYYDKPEAIDPNMEYLLDHIAAEKGITKCHLPMSMDVNDGHTVFSVPVSHLLPNFQLQVEGNSIRLRIFQIASMVRPANFTLNFN